MENASKALLIAGGILIALIIISIGIYMMNGYSSVQEEMDATKKTEQIKAFNSQYEAYNKKVMRGIDVLTLINKAVDYNSKSADNDSKNRIEVLITINDITTSNDKLKNGKYIFTSDNPIKYSDWCKDTVIVNSKVEKVIDNFKTKRYFECTKVIYEGRDGKISGMEFVECTKEVTSNTIDYETMR